MNPNKSFRERAFGSSAAKKISATQVQTILDLADACYPNNVKDRIDLLKFASTKVFGRWIATNALTFEQAALLIRWLDNYVSARGKRWR